MSFLLEGLPWSGLYFTLSQHPVPLVHRTCHNQDFTHICVIVCSVSALLTMLLALQGQGPSWFCSPRRNQPLGGAITGAGVRLVPNRFLFKGEGIHWDTVL